MYEKKHIPIFVLALVVAFVLGFYTVHFFDKKEKPKLSSDQIVPLSLHAQILEPQNTNITNTYIGYITPIHDVNVKPYIAGFIDKIYVKGGQVVKKGDILVVIKQDEYVAALQSAYADILKADANYQNAEKYFLRMKKAAKSVSASEFESAETAYLAAAATLEQAKANYAMAEANYDYTLIRAPIDGVVGDVSLSKGDYVSPSGGALFNVVQYNPIRVVFSLCDKEYLHELQKKTPFAGEKLLLKLPNGEIFEYEGIYVYMDNTIDKKTTSVSVYADFKNIGKILTPNTYVTVLAQNEMKNIIEVSKNLISFERDGDFLYLVRDGKLIKEQVTILASEGENFVLKNTFHNGDAVVTDNVDAQNLGAHVKIITTKEKA